MEHLTQGVKEKKACPEEKSGRAIPADFMWIMLMATRGGGRQGDKQEVTPKKDIFGFHK